jgi:hypothetical protein
MMQHSKWTNAHQLMNSAKKSFDHHRHRLRSVLEESNKLFHPFRDPLVTDFGVNRWLSNQREEAWSDWLEWALSQIKTPSDIYAVFNIPVPDVLREHRAVTFSTQREVSVLKGHLNRSGRLDIVVQFGKVAILVIEVKVTNADVADVEKHQGYCEWIRDQGIPATTAIVLAIDGTKEKYGDFSLVRWATVTSSLRKYVHQSTETDLVIRALFCGFIGAIEQRLLGFRPSTIRDIVDDRLLTFDTRVIDYLDATLKG